MTRILNVIKCAGFIILAVQIFTIAHLSAQLAGGVGGFPGPGTAHSTGASYQGPGDVFSTSPFAAWSCSRAFTASYAAATGNLCDLVDSAAPTTVICTLKALTTGKVDLAGTYCTGGLTPAAKCAAATGGVCNISQVYDQTGNGRHMTQATAASQPLLAFSSTPNGTLAAINCTSGARFLANASLAQTQPFTASIVYIRASGTALGGALGTQGGDFILGAHSTANTAVTGNTTNLTAAATDAAWHALTSLLNGASGAINVDGSDTTGNAGNAGIAAQAVRLCRAQASQLNGSLAEAWMWGASSTSTQRNDISANAHNSTDGYNF